MGAVKNLVTDILADIDDGELSLEQIALKHEVSLREVHDLAFEPVLQDEGYEDRYLDAAYEDRYDLADF